MRLHVSTAAFHLGEDPGWVWVVGDNRERCGWWVVRVGECGGGRWRERNVKEEMVVGT